MKFEDLKSEIELVLPAKPWNWRKGQFVFNYIDEVYDVARAVQFEDKVDCYYDDTKIDQFLEKAAARIDESVQVV